jgi:hypothetical protein
MELASSPLCGPETHILFHGGRFRTPPFSYLTVNLWIYSDLSRCVLDFIDIFSDFGDFPPSMYFEGCFE